VLHYLPFAALTDGKRYLSDDYTLFSLPSASILRFIQDKRKPHTDTILALGNPTIVEPLPNLRFAQQEAQTIAGLYDTQALVRADATESTVWSRASEAGILHLAAHGRYNRFNPLFSTLHLAGDSQHDGRLEVHEIYGLDLTRRTDLVVLSACQTVIGKMSAGDEIVGLNRAFLYAGTPSVIASLWSVDDFTTTLLMEHFYTHLQAGMGKAEALRKAQVWLRDLTVAELRDSYSELMEGTEYEYLLKLEATERPFVSPYYWSAFVLSGDPGEIGDIQPTIIEDSEDTVTQSSSASPEPTATEVIAEEPRIEETATSSPKPVAEEGAGGSCLTLMVSLVLLGIAGIGWRSRKRQQSI